MSLLDSSSRVLLPLSLPLLNSLSHRRRWLWDADVSIGLITFTAAAVDEAGMVSSVGRIWFADVTPSSPVSVHLAECVFERARVPRFVDFCSSMWSAACLAACPHTA